MLSKIRSTSNVIHVRFTSDGTSNGAGFVIEYACVTGIVKLQRFTFGYFLFFIYPLVRLTCFGVRVSVMFHFMFVHYTFSSVWVAEWPPFG